MAKKNLGIGFDNMDVEDMEFDEQGNLIEGGGTTSDNNDDNNNDNNAEEETPETVGNDDTIIHNGGYNEEEDSTTTRRGGSSPNKYSSIAKTLRDEGAVDASDEELESITNADEYVEFMRTQALKRMDDMTQGYVRALQNGANRDEVAMMFRNNQIVNSIKEDDITNEENDELRRQIIEQNYLNKGYSDVDAQKLAKMAFDEANDIEEAKAALAETKQYYKDSITAYNQRANEAKAARYKSMTDRSERIKKSVMDDKNAFGGMDLDAKTRKSIVSCINDIAYRDNNGVLYNGVQKWMLDDYEGAMKGMALLAVLTNNGKDYSKLFGAAAKKEVSKARQELMDFIEGNDNNGGHMHLVGQHEANKERKVGIVF